MLCTWYDASRLDAISGEVYVLNIGNAMVRFRNGAGLWRSRRL